MPTLSQFYGISIRMYYNDHAPPHFHALYGGQEIVVAINPIQIMQGNASQRVKSLTLEWAALHQQELIEDWERCRNAEQPAPIAPLD